MVEVQHLSRYFAPARRRATIRAVDDVTLDLRAGETLALVGESGCGKTTLLRTIARLLEPTAGTITVGGRDVSHRGQRALRPLRADMQMVFQDPFASLNPRKRIGQAVSAGLLLKDRRDTKPIAELLERVGLAPEHADRFPHEFSGGQRQRIGIARALAVEPRVILLDEPVSALDVSVQAQILNLLRDLQDALGLTYLFVAHDLAVVRHLADRVAVMYLGKIVELATAEQLYGRPIMPYTNALLAAVPVPEPRRRGRRSVVGGDPPSPADPPPGCRFHPRCPRATDVCTRVEPPLAQYAGGHLAACHHPLNVSPEDVAAATRSPASPLSAGDELPQAS